MRKLNNALLCIALLALFSPPSMADPADKAYEDGDYKKAFELFQARALDGELKAQNYLGVMYDEGRGVAEDDAMAVKWYRKAAQAGDANSQANLGWMYLNGLGIEQDAKQAVQWYLKAAKQGHLNAQTTLGWIYAEGRGLPKNDQLAVGWYRLAAKRGFARAQYNLGWMYIKGRGVKQSHEEAAKWFQKAAEQGHTMAQTNLGEMYRNGYGVKQDYKIAVDWYTKATAKGNAMAQSNLGEMYRNGTGVNKDATRAVSWFQKSAAQGNKLGIRNLHQILTLAGYATGPNNEVYDDATRLAADSYLKDHPKTEVETATDQQSNPLLVVMDEKSEAKDTTPPTINLNQDNLGNPGDAEQKTIQGQALDESGVAKLVVNGKEITLDPEGRFRTDVVLAPGKNAIDIVATDTKLNEARKSIVLERSIKQNTPPPVAAPLQTGRYYALLIAVQDYAKGGFPDLTYPANDVIKVKGLLEEYRFNDKDITLLINPGREKILDALDELNEKITPQDNLLIYFSGRGVWDKESTQGYWLPANARKNRKARWLSHATLLDYIKGFKAKHTLLVADAGFSDGMYTQKNKAEQTGRDVAALYQLTSRSILTAPQGAENSDKSMLNLGFVQQLEQNKDTYLSAHDLFIKVKGPLGDKGAAQNLPEYGSIQGVGDQGGEFIFVRSSN